MPSPGEHRYTSEDYWNLSEGRRAELIDGQLYDMAPPGRIHQELISEFTQLLGSYIKSHGGACKVYPAPFAVNLDADDKDWVEPDVSVVCDLSKLDDRGCNGAPDLVVEVVLRPAAGWTTPPRTLCTPKQASVNIGSLIRQKSAPQYIVMKRMQLPCSISFQMISLSASSRS